MIRLCSELLTHDQLTTVAAAAVYLENGRLEELSRMLVMDVAEDVEIGLRGMPKQRRRAVAFHIAEEVKSL